MKILLRRKGFTEKTLHSVFWPLFNHAKGEVLEKLKDTNRLIKEVNSLIPGVEDGGPPRASAEVKKICF